MAYRRCGRSGLKLPADLARPVAELRRRRAARQQPRDRPPGVRPRHHALRPGQQLRPAVRARRRTNFGRHPREDLRRYRDELVISTKAGYDMWPGPVRRVGLAQVPAGEPRPEPAADGPRLRRHLLLAPLRPRHAARGDDGRARHGGAQGKALLRRASPPTRPQRTREAVAILRELGTPLLIHQPSYSMLNRWIEPELLDVLERGGRSAASCSRRSRRACSPTGT